MNVKKDVMRENGEKTNVSVIIPVYNQELEIARGISALLREQTISCKIEILLINDGSTDSSGEVCRRLTDRYSEIRYFEQKNRGVSAARNLGIRNAKGKYLFYMDADDRFERGTLSRVKHFFDAVEQEVDLVTYRIDTIYEGKKLKPHFRYQYLQKSGVYDLKEYAYIGQTTMNIAVRNKYGDNVLFDENQTFSEDQQYCCRVLRDKLKMGYCAEGRYLYFRNPNSASGRMAGACYVYEQSTAMFEEVFSWYKDEVPAAFQGLFVNDFYWKLCCNMLYPHHYTGEKYRNAVERLLVLLRRCSSKMILEHPNIDFFEKYYILRLKGRDTMEWRIRSDGFGLFCQDICTVWENSVEIVMTKCAVRGKRVIIRGFLKTVFFQFYEQIPMLCAIENNGRLTRKIQLRSSAHNYYLSHESTQRFWAFTYECEAEETQQVHFEMGIGAKWFPVHYYFMPCVPFSHRYQRYEFSSGGFRVCMDGEGVIHIEKAPAPPGRAIWLYYDCAGVACDNGMLQFRHDYGKQDGIERYYVVSDVRQWGELPDRQCGVVWGSRKHRRMFRKCEKILTAYIEESNVIPYSKEQYDRYAGNFNWEVVYLQHGVLHIDMPWKYTPERMLADRIVVSTVQEAGLYERNGFCGQDLIRCRMPRFETRNQEKNRGKRILYAPSWRSYLVGKYGQDHRWERMDGRFETSDYYRRMRILLETRELLELLEQYDMDLDFKLHPIFADYRGYFEGLSRRIHVIEQSEGVEEYAVFITDFSSYLYDYLFAGIPVFLYLPDEKEFRCGMNGYRDMGETAEYWDKVNTEPERLIGQMRDYLERGIYRGIQADFFENGEPAEAIYQRETALCAINGKEIRE